MRLLWLAVAASAGGLSPASKDSVPPECQPRAGRHLHTPLFHLMGRMVRFGPRPSDVWPLGATDGNAIFQHGESGVYHAMHQTPNQTSSTPNDPTRGYLASWGHAVSRDLAHWRRVPNALDPDRNSSYDFHDGDCDGTVSFPGGALGTIMTFGPDCARPLRGPIGRARRGRVGDAPRVAIARPRNGSDPDLVRWLKDQGNPVEFEAGSPPCAFSGNVWRAPGGGYSMICAINALGNVWGRYHTADASLHGPWELADEAFAPAGGVDSSHTGSFPPCQTLPSSVPCAIGSISAPSFVPVPGGSGTDPDHIINMGGGRGYALGRYDALHQTLNISDLHAVQWVESMGSQANWFVAGSTNDGRVLHIGFFEPRDGGLMYDWAYSLNRSSFTLLTTPRVLRYEPTWQQLTSNPPDELKQLRNGTLFNYTNRRVDAGASIELATASSAADVELLLALPTASGDVLSFELQLLASPTSAGRSTNVVVEVGGEGPAGVRCGNLTIETPRTSAPTGGSGSGSDETMHCTGGACVGWAPWGLMTANFTVYRHETVLALRILVDRSVVEAFAAGGRAVVSARDFPAEHEVAAQLRTGLTGPLLVRSAIGFSMGCGWKT